MSTWSPVRRHVLVENVRGSCAAETMRTFLFSQEIAGALVPPHDHAHPGIIAITLDLGLLGFTVRAISKGGGFERRTLFAMHGCTRSEGNNKRGCHCLKAVRQRRKVP